MFTRSSTDTHTHTHTQDLQKLQVKHSAAAAAAAADDGDDTITLSAVHLSSHCARLIQTGIALRALPVFRQLHHYIIVRLGLESREICSVERSVKTAHRPACGQASDLRTTYFFSESTFPSF